MSIKADSDTKTAMKKRVDRRELLKFLAASPLLTSYSAFAQEAEEVLGERLTDPSEVINVFEMEAVARKNIPPAHLGYLNTGVDSDNTLRANRDGFTRFQIKPRRLVDVSETDTRVNILGTEASSPIFLCPVGSQGAYHPEAEWELHERRLPKGITWCCQRNPRRLSKRLRKRKVRPSGTSSTRLTAGNTRLRCCSALRPPDAQQCV